MFISLWSHRECVSASLTSHCGCWSCSHDPGLTESMYLPHWHLIMVSDNVLVILTSQRVCIFLSDIPSWSLTMCLSLWPHSECVSVSLKSHHGYWQCTCDSGLTGSVYLLHEHAIMVTYNVPATLDSQLVCICSTDILSCSLTMYLSLWTHRECVSASLTSHHGHWQCSCHSGLTDCVYLVHWHLIMVTDNIPVDLDS
jgi:hypothetical protein